jgi:hypothetical protein
MAKLLPLGKTFLFTRRRNHVSCLYRVNLGQNEIKLLKIQLEAIKDLIIWSP